MTLPASGSLSASQIQTEFGGSNPISLSEYYGRASGIPGSGAISFSQFRGKSAYVPPSFNPPPGTYLAKEYTGVTFSITCNKSAVWTYTRTGQTAYNSTSPASGSSSTYFSTTQGTTSTNKNAQSTVTVYATADGTQYGPWTITVRALGDI